MAWVWDHIRTAFLEYPARSNTRTMHSECEVFLVPDLKGKAEPKPSSQIGSNLAQSRYPAIKSLQLNARTSTRGRIVLGPRSTRQPGIKLLSKCIAVCKRKRRRTAPDIAAGSHCVHKISHAEYSTNCIGGITLAPRIDRIAALGDDFGRQGNICRHHQVPRRHTLNNFVVGDVEAL